MRSENPAVSFAMRPDSPVVTPWCTPASAAKIFAHSEFRTSFDIDADIDLFAASTNDQKALVAWRRSRMMNTPLNAAPKFSQNRSVVTMNGDSGPPLVPITIVDRVELAGRRDESAGVLDEHVFPARVPGELPRIDDVGK